MTLTTPVLPRLRGLYTTLCAALVLCFVATLASAQGYAVRPGDSLRIEVLEDPSLNRTVLVAPDGRISVPTAGTLKASGQTVESVQRNLTQRLSGNFASAPNVFVGVERLGERRVRSTAPAAPVRISVYVMGEVSRPGKLELEPGTTALQAFAVMGGFTKFAATKRIQVRRVQNKRDTVTKLNYDAIESGVTSGRMVLKEGDVIVVPQRRLFE